MPRHPPLALCSLKSIYFLSLGCILSKTKCNTVLSLLINSKEGSIYIDARARYAILKELAESPDTEASPEGGIPLSQNEREDDKSLVLFRNSSR